MTSNNTPLPPGPELDRLVGKKLGYDYGVSTGRHYRIQEPRILRGGLGVVPKFSEDMGDAWRMVEFMRNKDYYFYVHFTAEQGWAAGFLHPDKMCSQFLGSTAPHAICLAFLAIPELV